MLRAGVAAGAVVAAGSAAEASAAPAPDFADTFAGVPDGPLGGRVSPTGHTWWVSGAGPNVEPVVLGRAVGPPRGHVPGDNQVADDPNPGATGGYAMVDLGGPVSRVEAEYRWDRSTSVSTGATIGTFRVDPDAEVDLPGTLLGSSAHLGITPAFMQFAVFSLGPLDDFEVLAPVGSTATTYDFDTPQVRDARTLHRARIVISGDTARVDVSGVPTPVYYRDPRIASVRAPIPFWEYYSVTGGTNLPRFTRVSASRG